MEGKTYCALLETTHYSHKMPVYIDDSELNPIVMGEDQSELAPAGGAAGSA
jgi:hypothetical protein